MSNVVTFPGARRAVPDSREAFVPLTDGKKISVADVVRPESHTAAEPVMPAQAEGNVPYVAMRLDVVERMVEALSFYARRGWDEGRKAHGALAGAA